MTTIAQREKNRAAAIKRAAGTIENLTKSYFEDFSARDLATLEAARTILARHGNKLGQEAKEKLAEEQGEQRRREVRKREAQELLQHFPRSTVLERVTFIMESNPFGVEDLSRAIQRKTLYDGSPKTAKEWIEELDDRYRYAVLDVTHSVARMDKPVREILDAVALKLAECMIRTEARDLAGIWEGLMNVDSKKE